MMIIPEGLSVGVPCVPGATPPPVPAIEIGPDLCELPTPQEVGALGTGRIVTLVAWHVITHRRSDPRYKRMTTPIPEHAAVGHFDRSRWTDEAWEHTDALARTVDAPAVILRTPPSFRSTAEHATRLENFVAHATRPGLQLAWEWAPGSWPQGRALELCETIGAIPVIDPLEQPVPDTEMVYARFRGAARRRSPADDDLKSAALTLRDRIGWAIFDTRTAVQDAERFLQMI